MTAKIINLDCRDAMAAMSKDSIDAIVCDPPYGISFMGKGWDHGVPGMEFWTEALRVLKPGGHLLAFGGTRTFHRLAVAIEDTGFEIRDCLSWMYGSGFPKSHNLKDERNGWGTALKPAWEPIIMARKPFAGTVAANVLAHGTGALNIDATRIGVGHDNGTGRDGEVSEYKRYTNESSTNFAATPGPRGGSPTGRWPANTLLTHNEECNSECVNNCPIRLLDEQSGERKAGGKVKGHEPSRTGQNGIYGAYGRVENSPHNDTGGASRFFYCAKTSKKERNAGLPDDMINNHPTVKPVAIMEWLVKMVTPPNGIVLDPFMGSGSTGVAAIQCGVDFIGVDTDEGYCDIASWRIMGVPYRNVVLKKKVQVVVKKKVLQR